MNIIRRILTRLFARKQPARYTFVDTPEAWEARKVIPGETREDAQRRLAPYRRPLP